MARSAISGLLDRSPAHSVSVRTLWVTRSPRCSTRYCTSAVVLRDCPSTANTGLPLTRISKSPNILISMVAILYPLYFGSDLLHVSMFHSITSRPAFVQLFVTFYYNMAKNLLSF